MANGKCDEQADIPNAQFYIPCGRPTNGVQYQHRSTGEGPYEFCDRHLSHNLNRGYMEVPFQ